jgi:hypothetical protein
VGVKPSIIADPQAALKHARSLLATDPAAATRQARQMLAASPQNPAILRVLAAGLRKLGDTVEAAKVEPQAVDASLRNPAHRDAARATAAGEKRRASNII